MEEEAEEAEEEGSGEGSGEDGDPLNCLKVPLDAPRNTRRASNFGPSDAEGEAGVEDCCGIIVVDIVDE